MNRELGLRVPLYKTDVAVDIVRKRAFLSMLDSGLATKLGSVIMASSDSGNDSIISEQTANLMAQHGYRVNESSVSEISPNHPYQPDYDRLYNMVYEEPLDPKALELKRKYDITKKGLDVWTKPQFGEVALTVVRALQSPELSQTLVVANLDPEPGQRGHISNPDGAREVMGKIGDFVETLTKQESGMGYVEGTVDFQKRGLANALNQAKKTNYLSKVSVSGGDKPEVAQAKTKIVGFINQMAKSCGVDLTSGPTQPATRKPL